MSCRIFIVVISIASAVLSSAVLEPAQKHYGIGDSVADIGLASELTVRLGNNSFFDCPEGTWTEVLTQLEVLLDISHGRLPANETQLVDFCSESEDPLEDIFSTLGDCLPRGLIYRQIKRIVRNHLEHLYNAYCTNSSELYEIYVEHAACISEHAYQLAIECLGDVVADVYNMIQNSGGVEVCCIQTDLEVCAESFLTTYCGGDSAILVNETLDILEGNVLYNTLQDACSSVECTTHAPILSTRSGIIECPSGDALRLFDDLLQMLLATAGQLPTDAQSLEAECYNMSLPIEDLVTGIEECLNQDVPVEFVENRISRNLRNFWDDMCLPTGVIYPVYLTYAQCIQENFVELTVTCATELIEDLRAIVTGNNTDGVVQDVCCTLRDMVSCAEGFLDDYCGGDSSIIVSQGVKDIEGNLVPAICSRYACTTHPPPVKASTRSLCVRTIEKCDKAFLQEFYSVTRQDAVCAAYYTYVDCMADSSCPEDDPTDYLPQEYRDLETTCASAAHIYLSWMAVLTAMLTLLYTYCK